jgi:hypothetical protein
MLIRRMWTRKTCINFLESFSTRVYTSRLKMHMIIRTCKICFLSGETGNRVKYVCSFFDDRWTKARATRSVTDVNWSHKVMSNICIIRVT